MKQLSILHTLALGVALVPCLSSCISDDSEGAHKPLSIISAASTVKEVYNVDNWDTLRIAAPEVTQEHTAKPLSYQWEVNGKVVSNEKDLAYVCKDYGTFVCRLKISNEDATYYKQFRLNVQYSYRGGLYCCGRFGRQHAIVLHSSRTVANRKAISSPKTIPVSTFRALRRPLASPVPWVSNKSSFRLVRPAASISSTATR